MQVEVMEQEERFEIRFRPILEGRTGYSFPCNRHGDVELDALGERARNDYLFARALVGRDLAPPCIELQAKRQGARA